MASNAGGMSKPAAAAGTTGGNAKVEVVLVSLRARALDIHSRLSELGDILAQVRDGVGGSRMTSWTEFLGMFDALSALAGQLCEELERAVGEAGLSHYVVHPSSKAPSKQDGEIPGLLRTRREPELERDVEALAASFQDSVTPEALTARIEDFNGFVDDLVGDIAALRDDHAPEPMTEPPRPRATPGANVVLAALATGAGL